MPDPSRTEQVNFFHVMLTKLLLNLTPSSQARIRKVLEHQRHKTSFYQFMTQSPVTACSDCML